MSLRSICALSAVTAAGLVVATAGPASSHGGPPCGPASAHTLAVDGQARVYAVPDAVFGCTRGSRPVVLGGSATSCLGANLVGPVALAASTAAYGSERCGVDTGSTLIVVQRLSDGRVLASAPADIPLGPESYTTVTAIVVRTGGSAAWIASSSSLGTRERAVEVWRLAAGRARRLDRGGWIAPRSLRLHGRRVTWRDGSRTRSATLG